MRLLHLIVMAALVCAAVTPPSTQQLRNCEPDGKIQFICGVVSPEDLVPVPRSDWVLTSGYIRGGVHVINTRTYSTTQVFPSRNDDTGVSLSRVV